jgi:hypothetical protein
MSLLEEGIRASTVLQGLSASRKVAMTLLYQMSEFAIEWYF